MYEITIDQNKCMGLDICRLCESQKQGITIHCAQYGKLMVSPESLSENKQAINNFIGCCPVQAIILTNILEN